MLHYTGEVEEPDPTVIATNHQILLFIPLQEQKSHCSQVSAGMGDVP